MSYEFYAKSRGLQRAVFDSAIEKKLIILDKKNKTLSLPIDDEGEPIDDLLFTVEKFYRNNGDVIEYDVWDTSDDVLTSIDKEITHEKIAGSFCKNWANEENIDDNTDHHSFGVSGRIKWSIYASDLIS
jgi:hypothetical protein